MKKFLMAACCALCLALGAKAQKNITVWYGGNIAGMSMEHWSPDDEFKALNIGVDYTAPINDTFDWSAGLSYQTKGCKDWDPGFLQIEGNGSYAFFKNDNLKLNLFTGPCINLLIAKDDAEDTKSIGFGWQGGISANISCIALKVGYEYGFTDVFDGGKSKPNQVFFRVGYTF